MEDQAGTPRLSRFEAQLDEFVALGRAEEAASSRARERHLRDQLAAEATMVGVLLSLAERADHVALSTAAGRRHRGQVVAVGADHVQLHTAANVCVLVPLAAVVAVHTQSEPVLDARAPTTERRLIDVLIDLASDRERVTIITVGGSETVAGTLWAVGRDVVVVRSEGTLATAAVALDAVAEVYVPAR